MEQSRGRGFRGRRRFNKLGRGRGGGRQDQNNVDTSDLDQQVEYSPYVKPQPKTQGGQSGGAFYLNITGYSPDTQRNDLLALLNQNAKFRFLQFKFDQNSTTISLATQEEASGVLSCNGLQLNGQRLSITKSQGAPVENTSKFVGNQSYVKVPVNINKKYIEEIMEKRVTFQDKTSMIDFSELQGQEIGNNTIIDFNSPNFVDQFLYFFSYKYKSTCQALNFGKNHLHTLSGLASLRRLFPSVKKINFAENRIQKFTDLDFIKDSQRCSAFTEISFAENPIFKIEGYSEEISARFPDLVYLDGKKISIKFSGEKRKVILGPPKPSFYDSQKTKELVEKFFVYYFKCLDEDRNKLIDLYADNAVLSCTYELYEGYEPNKESADSLLQKMNTVSRNLKKLTDIKQRQELLYKEKIPVVSFFIKDFPKTVHDMKDITVDAYMLTIEGQGTVIFANIHGAFQETQTKYLRAYDRVVILAPKKDSSIPVVIVNENIHVRPYQKSFLFQLEEKGIQSSTPIQQQQIQVPKELEHMDNVKKIAFHQLKTNTKMKDKFVFDCLERCQWDYQKAVELFQKSKLPKEYFEA